MESSNGEAARLASGVHVCGLRRCPDLKNRMGTFLATSSCPLPDPIVQEVTDDRIQESPRVRHVLRLANKI
jgi:hypothetical protein